jgi:rhodanese-related sulfurtransferase
VKRSNGACFPKILLDQSGEFMPVQISPATLKEWLDQGHSVYLLDVREPWENQFAAIPNSVLVSLGDLSNSLDEVTPPKDAKVVVYCHHGVRSLSGAAILENAGITPAYSLAGGIEAWSCEIDPNIPRYR